MKVSSFRGTSLPSKASRYEMNSLHHSSTNISPMRDQRAWNGRMGQVNSLFTHSCSVRLLIEVRQVQRSFGTRVTGSRRDGASDGGFSLEVVGGTAASGGRTSSGGAVPGCSVVASLGCASESSGSEVGSDSAGSWVSGTVTEGPSELFESSSGAEFCWSSVNKSSSSKSKRHKKLIIGSKVKCITVVCYTQETSFQYHLISSASTWKPPYLSVKTLTWVGSASDLGWERLWFKWRYINVWLLLQITTHHNSCGSNLL